LASSNVLSSRNIEYGEKKHHEWLQQ